MSTKTTTRRVRSQYEFIKAPPGSNPSGASSFPAQIPSFVRRRYAGAVSPPASGRPQRLDTAAAGAIIGAPLGGAPVRQC